MAAPRCLVLLDLLFFLLWLGWVGSLHAISRLHIAFAPPESYASGSMSESSSTFRFTSRMSSQVSAFGDPGVLCGFRSR